MKRLASSQPLAFFFRLALVGATMTLLSPASWAMSWTKLVETQTMTFYVNRNAIEREGDIAAVIATPATTPTRSAQAIAKMTMMRLSLRESVPEDVIRRLWRIEIVHVAGSFALAPRQGG